MSARLSRCVQPRGHGAARQGRHDRRLAQEPGHRRLHLREGPASSASASTARTGCSIRPSARAARATASSSASPWDEALELVAERLQQAKATHGGESILPYSYGGSNGLLTQDNLDAQLWRRFGTSRLARTVCAAPTGAANMALYGKMPSVTYQDYPEAAADHPLGRQPVRVGHSPRPVRARGAEARREARRHRSADDAAGAVGRRAPRGEAGHRRRRRAGDPPLPVRERLRRRGVPARAHARRRRAARARRAVDVRARPQTSPASTPSALEQVAELYADELAGARSAAAGASSATATAATRRWRCWRCRRSAASSACAAAATR